jgi:hypothetical protein
MQGVRNLQPSKGQQCLQLWIQGWLRLLGLALGEQIKFGGEGYAYVEPNQPDQTPGPAILTEQDQQGIAAGRE